ncbi:MAG TPA: sulfotransferase domain-containing protein [Nocardioides sp.]|nr:sulfotransferase domain-containing protein [Nocardioides sp.]
MRSDTVPDFLYIGTSKAGSTWLFNALSVHPDVWLASNKGLYFFDSHFDRGPDWYREQFEGADGRAVGEFSHSYLSSPEAPERIAAYSPAMRLLVCLREPVDRAFSDYLDLVKNNGFTGSFTKATEQYPRLLDRGRYATHLSRYLEHFPAAQLHVGLFDDLKTGAQGYADEVYDFLGIERVVLSAADLRERMPAGRPRNAGMVGLAKRASRLAASVGLRRWRSRIKRSTMVRSALYKQYRDDKPRLDPALAAELRAGFADEVARLDVMLGRPVSERWGYTTVEPQIN